MDIAYFLHLSLSSVIRIDSSTASPVHVLMLSIQAVRGFLYLCAPGILPCVISFSGQLSCVHSVLYIASLLCSQNGADVGGRARHDGRL